MYKYIYIKGKLSNYLIILRMHINNSYIFDFSIHKWMLEKNHYFYVSIFIFVNFLIINYNYFIILYLFYHFNELFYT